MTEFGFIDNIKTLFSTTPLNGFEGIGDDCAVLSVGGGESLLYTSDMLVEDIHFSRLTTSAFDLGYKSLAVNISDIAAMGAKPVATLLSLSLPKDISDEWAMEFMRGYHSLSQKHSVALIGGDTTASKGQITINVTAIGRAADSQIKRRADAQVGDIIFVTSLLGESAVGLRDLTAGRLSTPQAQAHCRPTPRVEEGLWLSEQRGVHAMMDISDGVASDIRHILSRSGVGARIELDSIPTNQDLRTALCGGEDYELLFTVEPTLAEALTAQFNKLFSAQITPIGAIIDSGVEWVQQGKSVADDFMGFRHFEND